MKKIELQLAMDGAATRTLDQAMEIIDRVAPYLDIIEIGTSFVLRYGMEPVSRVKAAHPDKKNLADMKVMDGGYHNCGLGCKAGGDIVTVLGVSDHGTIQNATKAAHDYGKQIMVDLICVKDVAETIAFCEEIGTDYICVHTGVDMQAQGKDPLDALKEALALVKNCKVSVAGGINEDTIEEICRLGPDAVIVGGGIYKKENYVQAAQNIRRCIDRISEVL